MALLEAAPTESSEDLTTNMHAHEHAEAVGGYFPDISRRIGAGSVMLAKEFEDENNID